MGHACDGCAAPLVGGARAARRSSTRAPVGSEAAGGLSGRGNVKRVALSRGEWNSTSHACQGGTPREARFVSCGWPPRLAGEPVPRRKYHLGLTSHACLRGTSHKCEVRFLGRSPAGGEGARARVRVTLGLPLMLVREGPHAGARFIWAWSDPPPNGGEADAKAGWPWADPSCLSEGDPARREVRLGFGGLGDLPLEGGEAPKGVSFPWEGPLGYVPPVGGLPQATPWREGVPVATGPRHVAHGAHERRGPRPSYAKAVALA